MIVFSIITTRYIKVYCFTILLQHFSKKCTGRYSKVREDDLSSKQGSLSTIKKILIKNYSKIFLSIYLHIFIFVIKLKHYMNFFCVNSIDKQTDFQLNTVWFRYWYSSRKQSISYSSIFFDFFLHFFLYKKICDERTEFDNISSRVFFKKILLKKI